MTELDGRLAFIQQAEQLKGVLRSAHAGTGRQESTAGHTWRLCLLAMTLQDVLGLREDCEYARPHEARTVKALDKIETIIQHNHGKNAAGFDHAFNLQYGLKHAGAHPLTAQLRALGDEQTRLNASAKPRPMPGEVA